MQIERTNVEGLKTCRMTVLGAHLKLRPIRTAFLLATCFLQLSKADSGGGKAYLPGQANYEAVETHGKNEQAPVVQDSIPPSRRNTCAGGICWHLVWLLPVATLSLVWLVSAPLSVPDWVRQRKYAADRTTAMSIQHGACSLENLPPSGTWTWRAGMTLHLLYLTFNVNGTLEGNGSGTYGTFVVTNGRFNAAKGEFVWEETYLDPQTRCETFAQRVLMFVRFGPQSLCAPLERHRRCGEQGPVLCAPRTLVMASGTEGDDGVWSLQGSYISYVKSSRGFVFDLVAGSTGCAINKEEDFEVFSPPGSPRSARPDPVSPRRSKTIDWEVRLDGDLAANGQTDLQTTIGVDAKPRARSEVDPKVFIAPVYRSECCGISI